MVFEDHDNEAKNMAANPKSLVTEQAYLEQERKAEFQSEYLNGEIFAVAGGTLRHARLITNFARVSGNQLVESSCEAITQDMRIQVSPGRLNTYPEEAEDTLLNPVLIVGVLSDSTRNYDLGGKFDLYRMIPTLREYVTVKQTALHIVTRQRQNDGSWLLRDYVDSNCDLPLPSVNAGIFLLRSNETCPLPLNVLKGFVQSLGQPQSSFEQLIAYHRLHCIYI